MASSDNLNTMASSDNMAMSPRGLDALNTMASSDNMAMSPRGLDALKIQKMEGSVSLWNVCGQINANITDDGEITQISLMMVKKSQVEELVV